MISPPKLFPSRAATIETFAKHVNRGKVSRFRDYGIDIVMGARAGSYFSDADSDRRWMNCHCNGGVFNLGHRNEKVMAAVQGALGTLDIGNHHLVSGYRARLAERLAATTDGLLPGVVFGVSGGEAIDLAIKVVRAHTRRQGIISAMGGYHGHTGLALATGDEQFSAPFGQRPPGFSQVPYNDIQALDRAIDGNTAAVILETIPATLGMPLPRPGYLREVARLCRERGAKLILDEVQAGLGRTGSFWCYQQEDVEPDVVVTGKGLSGGIYPITATLMTRELHALFDTNPFVHISTFGGAEPGCAAALAVLDIVESPGFHDRTNALSDRFAAAFRDCKFELRRRGLMMALKFDSSAEGLLATKILYDAGVFVVYSGNDNSAVQFLPPLTISDQEVDDLIDIVVRSFGSTWKLRTSQLRAIGSHGAAALQKLVSS